MISARLRYAGLVLAGAAFAVLAFLYACSGRPAAVLLCLVLTGVCWEACSYVRRAAEQLQALHHQARRRARADMLTGIDPWARWCCEAGFVSHGRQHDATCVRERP
ncbi:hypothetical protein ACIRD8_35140 [Streptomyces sp. NPDC102451]|uniref:hypothetical protein n=1 Tax=Streptomyces sp. NPDC102451 TaxID=3366177 RepID=UPI0038029FE9